MKAARAAAAFLFSTLLLTACPARPAGSASSDAARQETPAPAEAPGSSPCEVAGGVLPVGASMEGRAGRYALELHATSGPLTGAMTRATLMLERSSRPSSAGVTYPLIGTTDARVADVGGSIPGTATSRDAMRPGVLVLEYPRAGNSAGARDVTVRLGSDANGAALAEQPFDGAYMALHVRQIDGAGFAGQWSSAAEGRTAGGLFCARRIAER